MHDIGNLVNRVDHSQSGAIMAFRVLDHLNMEPSDVAEIVTAIGNHDEGNGIPVNAISAVLIIADKADVRRSRVRNQDAKDLDIHDRVNYSVVKSQLKINTDHTIIKLKLNERILRCASKNYIGRNKIILDSSKLSFQRYKNLNNSNSMEKELIGFLFLK